MSTWAARLSTSSKSPESRHASNQGTPFFGPQATPSPPPGMDGFSLTSSPTGGGANSANTNNNVSWKTARQLAEEEETKALKEEFRQIAEMHNKDTKEVPVLRLPLDTFEYITCFLSYADVVQLAHTCRHLWSFLMEKESVWEQQLRFFHEDILDMRGGSLLMTNFAIPTGVSTATTTSRAKDAAAQQQPQQRRNGASVSARHRFWLEKRLYVLDAHREWHFRELASLEDKETGIFTVPLHMGQETVASSAAAPLSRPDDRRSNLAASGQQRESTTHTASRTYRVDPTTASEPEGTPTMEASPPPLASTPTAPGFHRNIVPNDELQLSPTVSPATAAPPVRMPAVGAPFIGPHRGNLRLQIFRPIRPGEPMLAPERADRPHPRQLSGEGVPSSSSALETTDNDLGPSPATPAAEGNEDATYLDSDVAAQATELYFPTDEPTTVEDEEAALAYVLALSEAEAKGLPPPPPPMYRRNLNRGNRGGGGGNSAGTGSFFSSSHGGQGTSPCQSSQAKASKQHQPCLSPSELMTVVEMINTGTVEQSRVPIRDITRQQSTLFLQALEETLKSAKRRRLHLGNHHRALLNNGQTTRHRSGRPQRPTPLQSAQAEQQNPFTTSTPHIASPPASPENAPSMATAMDMVLSGNVPRQHRTFTGLMETTRFEQLPPPQQTQASPPPPPPPPVNRILKHFTGQLLEITKREAYAVCNQLMNHPEIVDDFSIFHSFVPNSSPAGSSHVPSTASAQSYPRTRFFLLPELAPHGFIGLVIVDVVRVLIAVEKDRASREEENTDWELEEGRMQAGRLFRPGQGYNAQYYERDEMRPL